MVVVNVNSEVMNHFNLYVKKEMFTETVTTENPKTFLSLIVFRLKNRTDQSRTVNEMNEWEKAQTCRRLFSPQIKAVLDERRRQENM